MLLMWTPLNNYAKSGLYFWREREIQKTFLIYLLIIETRKECAQDQKTQGLIDQVRSPRDVSKSVFFKLNKHKNKLG